MPHPELHQRLVDQLHELGIDPSQAIPSAKLQELLSRVSAAYVEAELWSDTLMTVLDTLSDTTCHVDRHGVLQGMNDRGIELFRCPAHQIMGRPLLDSIRIEDAGGRRLTEADLTRDARIEQGHVTRPDGSRFAASVSISRISEDRRDEGSVIVLRDIEDLLEREEELQRARVEALVARKAERTKTLFLANMSHELRTPLNAIIGYSEMLYEEAEASGRLELLGDLERIRAAGRHLTHLIGDILDLSKIESGRMELFFEPCDVVALARQSVETFRPTAESKGLELVFEALSAPPWLRVDVTRLRQCFDNLLSNAVKFTERGQVTLRIAHDGDDVRISIADTGIGIAHDTLDRLFTEFVQADQTTTRRFGGTGLGLALSRRLCRLMGGDIEVESFHGEGSTFTIVLPVHPAEAPETAVAEEVNATILVIDDDHSVRELLERMLHAEGYTVVSAATGRAGVDLARQLRPDAIILDVLMPEVDGWSVLAALKSDEALRRTPVVLLTMLEDRSRGYALGAAEYLVKPVERARLMDVLARLCGPTGTALVVDDNPEIRALVSRQLGSFGWDVVEAAHGRAALGALEEQRPDVILLDLMMPEMDGFEFLEHLRADQRNADLPVVVLTAMELTEGELASLERSVQRILRKGAVGRRELVEELRARLTRRRSPAEPVAQPARSSGAAGSPGGGGGPAAGTEG